MTSKSIEVIPRPPLTPFRRHKSRVFYASDDHLLEADEDDNEIESTHTISSTSSGSLKISVPSHYEENHFAASSSPTKKSSFDNHLPISDDLLGADFFCNSPTSRVIMPSLPLPSTPLYSPNHFGSCSRIPEMIEERSEEEEEEEASHSCSEESPSPICSPPGSWRGSDRSSSNGSWRCSPSQRSQDSGYSDSGESGSGSPSEDSPPVPEATEEPQVKHITRVYFGDYQRQTGVNESTQTPPHYVTPRTHRVAKRRISSFRSQTLSRSEPKLSDAQINKVTPSLPLKTPTVTFDDSPPKPKDYNLSPTINSSNKDEIECQLEHKSLSSVSSLSSSETPKSSSSSFCSSSQNIHNSTFTCDLNQSISSSSSASIISSCSTTSSRLSRSSSASESRFEKYSNKIYRKLSYAKKYAAKKASFRSTENLTTTPKSSKRRDPLKAKRRWSSAEVDTQKLSNTTIHEDREYVHNNTKSPLEIADYLG